MVLFVGISVDTELREKPRNRKHERYFVKSDLPKAVARAGAEPLLIPNVAGAKGAARVMERLDGLVLSGGHFDIDPAMYGEKRSARLGKLKPERTHSEMLLLEGALKMGKPVLGICGGEQLINVFFGGTLYQDILTEKKKARDHEQKTSASRATHQVEILKGSLLRRAVRSERLKVNSTHHQAVKEPGRGLIPNAISPDGVIEGVEAEGDGFVLGVQWHPEYLTDVPAHLGIFRTLVSACRNPKKG